MLNFLVTENLSAHKKLCVLIPSNWDDYSFKTSFQVYYFDLNGKRLEVGTVKIGFQNQEHGRTSESIERKFQRLPATWFSLGQDVEYYKRINEIFTKNEKEDYFKAMADAVYDLSIFETSKDNSVFKDSLMRGVSLSSIHGQFKRVISGLAELTDYKFRYSAPGDQRHAEINLDFNVEPTSKPPTNIHVLIGRNGVGKTTLLNNMIDAAVNNREDANKKFKTYDYYSREVSLSNDYFSSLISVSFSAFDPFIPPADRSDRSLGIGYFYIGMKKTRINTVEMPPKSEHDLAKDFIESYESCLSQPNKTMRLGNALNILESDSNFAEMDLLDLLKLPQPIAVEKASNLFKRMSSGHSIVLLTITKLVDLIEEKTLVLMDEPESHLHPPLLSAFTRALSDLLHDRNAVAIIATHSPVVLQEVPKSCVWKLTRIRSEGRQDRPERETFGENVGVLTREVFGLEVEKSGYHSMLASSVNSGKSFDEILEEYNDQLGAEAQAILRSMINTRSSDGDSPL
ncbi:AAA family ATPase [Pseudomonas syringae]|uniref:AAA family ATPase n=1 Tax=Pseudomonas syringae TaxID=317 RepID=UPI001F0F245F|nr:AAA family ATPase [Pseudomonas syringae]MCH5521554.1 ATP-binding protein [Pseudomonas syringae pv. lapsa]